MDMTFNLEMDFETGYSCFDPELSNHIDDSKQAMSLVFFQKFKFVQIVIWNMSKS